MVAENAEHIFGNYEKALKGVKEMFGRPEMALKAIKRFLGDLAEFWELPKSGIFKGLWLATVMS